MRENSDLTQEEVATAIGLKRSTYTSYEIGRDNIPLIRLNSLCNYFNISMDYALGLTKVKRYPNSRKEIDREKLKERIKMVRKANHLTQKEMASILNTSRSTWTGYEYGKYLMPTLILYEIAKKFNCKMDYLIGKID
jgi:transcriptional regulator with XRE-family HTH domain